MEIKTVAISAVSEDDIAVGINLLIGNCVEYNEYDETGEYNETGEYDKYDDVYNAALDND